MKTLIITFSFLISTVVFSQSITNTLGNGGLFTIKDASNNYFTLSQSTGQVNILGTIRLKNTTNSGLGIIYKDSSRFLHNYGVNNTYLGINAGNISNFGHNNTGVGHSSLGSVTTGYYNTAVGYGSLTANTTGNSNTAVGWASLYFNTTGISNTAMGVASLYKNITGVKNTAVGEAALYLNTEGEQNTAIGFNALYLNTNGNYNTAVGLNSLFSNVFGTFNTAIGMGSLLSNTGNYNTAVGFNSLYLTVNGESNTAMGYRSLYLNTGSFNTAFGYNAGSTIQGGSNLICIGKEAQPSSSSATNEITLGNNQITSLRCNVTSITSLSDARDKKNITDLTLGLDFLMKVKPRQFNWDKREWYEGNKSDGSKMKETPTAGFISQELDEAQTSENADWLNLVLKDNPEKLEATYGNLLPVMVKAIQELEIKNEELRIKNDNLTLEIESLMQMKDKILKLENMISRLTSVNNTSIIEPK